MRRRYNEMNGNFNNYGQNGYMTNGTCRHIWIPICYYRLSDGTRWIRRKCENCGQLSEQQMTGA